MKGQGRRSGGRAVRRLAALAVVIALGGCARFNPQSYTTPQSLYDASLREFRKGNFARADQGFTKLTFDLAPRDTLRVRARFFSAECKFGLRDYVTAARDFRRIADDDPGEALAPEALLRSGDAHAQLWRRAELDPSSGQTAMATYQELLGRYPGSRAAEIAQARVRQLNDQFAMKDYQTGVFYFRRGGYDSAILYFRSVIAQYPTSSVVPDAFVRLVRAYRAIGYREEMDETCQTLRQYYGGRADVRELCGDGNPRR
jgi:outer membrane protein assembly factor BamD